MNSRQIEQIIYQSKYGNKYFRGCYPCDKIPNSLFENKHSFAYIINEDDSSNKGTHWVALFIKDFENVYYFDSYAVHSNIYVNNFNKNFKKIHKNCIPYQSIFSDVCAHYCIYFILSMSVGISFNKLLTILSSHSNSDYFVKHFVRRIISK